MTGYPHSPNTTKPSAGQKRPVSSSALFSALLLRLGRPIAQLYYDAVKRRHPVRHKVTLLSRQSANLSLDFRLLIAELRERDPELEIAVHSLRDEGGMRGLKAIISSLSSELRDVASSQAVILDGYNPAISYFDQRPELYVLQIWHALGAIKRFSMQSLDTTGGRSSALARAARMHHGYSQILCGGAGSIQVFAEAFGVAPECIVTALLPRVDELRTLRSQPGAADQLLYTPTFRDSPQARAQWCNAALELADAADVAGLNLTIILHPLSFVQMQRDGLADELAALTPYLETGRSTQELLPDCAHLITDYSAVAFEAALAGRNVWFYDYDLDEYLAGRGLNIDTALELPEATYQTAPQLIEALRDAAPDSKVSEASQAFFSRYLAQEEGSATTRVADMVLSNCDSACITDHGAQV